MFGEPFDETDIITTERQRRTPDDSAKDFSYQDYKRIKEEALKLKDFDEDDDLDEQSNFSSLGKFKLCLSCGRISEFLEKTDYTCWQI